MGLLLPPTACLFLDSEAPHHGSSLLDQIRTQASVVVKTGLSLALRRLKDYNGRVAWSVAITTNGLLAVTINEIASPGNLCFW